MFSQYSAVKIISETLYEIWEKQSANTELFRHSNILSVALKCNITEMTICLHTIKGAIMIKNSTSLWNDNMWLFRENWQSHRTITTVLATNSFVCSEKSCVYPGSIETIQMKDCCHALEIFFKLNEDITLKLQTYLNVKICMWYWLVEKWLPDYWAINKNMSVSLVNEPWKVFSHNDFKQSQRVRAWKIFPCRVQSLIKDVSIWCLLFINH